MDENVVWRRQAWWGEGGDRRVTWRPRQSVGESVGEGSTHRRRRTSVRCTSDALACGCSRRSRVGMKVAALSFVRCAILVTSGHWLRLGSSQPAPLA